MTFEWSLEVDENGARTRRSLNESDTFTGLNKANVAIKQGVLDRNKTYVLKLKARRSSIQKESLSVYQFRTSSVPYGGTCTVK